MGRPKGNPRTTMSPSEGDDRQPRQDFTFVTGPSGHGSRSHAMRAHWKQRRQRIEQQKRKKGDDQIRKLLPSTPTAPVTRAAGDKTPPPKSVGTSSPGSLSTPERDRESTALSTSSGRGSSPSLSAMREGIPAQVLSTTNIALGSGRLDPFDMFPVKLTTQHHRLLHHWLSTFAGMMFNIRMSDFNPMRDVWFPLDLSNAASFNAIMAHSAAHLARMQGYLVSSEALRFKSEAVRIVHMWAIDPALSTSDEIIAAVLRLMSFERYWGSESEWQIHHNGLLRIIKTRGGIATLQGNWRLELAAFLVTLMSRPSWFDSSNQLGEISQQPIANHPFLGQTNNLYKLRCIWLVSFMQDMSTFMNHSPEIYQHGLARYTSILGSLHVIKMDLSKQKNTQREDGCDKRESMRLACLFYICVMLQTSTGHDAQSNTPADLIQTGMPIGDFNDCLAHSRTRWQDSIEDLYRCLFHHAILGAQPSTRVRYALDMTNVLSTMSSEARYGVERCILQILCQAALDTETQFDSDWTPDNLLASMDGH